MPVKSPLTWRTRRPVGADGDRARAGRGQATTVMSRPIVTPFAPTKRAVEFAPTLSPEDDGRGGVAERPGNRRRVHVDPERPLADDRLAGVGVDPARASVWAPILVREPCSGDRRPRR